MPFARPTLSDLRSQIMADINANLSSANAWLRKSVLYVLAIAMAGLAFLHYGYIDWISLNAVPWTATGEYLAAWGALKNVYQKSAVAAQLTVQFSNSSPGQTIGVGIGMQRTDGESYTIQTSATVAADGTATVTVLDTTAGAAGNCAAGTQLTLSTTIDGVQSTAVVTGTVVTGVDTETTKAFGARVLAAFQQFPQGGAKVDYEKWALAIAGVTRAWCSPNGMGPGTVVLRFMMDNADASYGGFPQGTNGVSQYDQGPDGLPRDTVATGDQLTVANAIVSEQPVTALLYAVCPIANSLNFTISGLSTSSTTTRSAISAAISNVLFQNGDPRGGTINLNDIESAINGISGTGGWLMESVTGTVGGVVTTYPGNITSAMGQLPVLGGINYV